MSNRDTRDAVAAAVSSIAGLKGYARRPNAPKPGDAWPQWRGGERVDGWALIHTWHVLLLLPGNEHDADAWVDEHGDALFVALEQHAFSVTTFTPATVPVNGNDALALLITGRSE